MRPLIARLVVPAAAGAVAGMALALARPELEGARTSSAAVLLVLAVAPCVAAAAHGRGGTTRRERLVGAAWFACGTVLAGAAALLTAGGSPSALAATLVPAAAALLALGVATAVHALGGRPVHATLAGAGLVAALSGSLLWADPFVEWAGAGARSGDVAAAFLDASPITAVTSGRGGTGVDWQRLPLLYDRGGLSLVGQYYPVERPVGPFVWAGLAALAGIALVGSSPVRATMQPAS